MGPARRSFLLASAAAMATSATVTWAQDSALAAQQPAAAQQIAPEEPDGDGGTSGFDEIVVTATRQREVLSRVPVSISAFSQENMDVQGVKQIDDVARLTPGLTFTRATGGNGTGNTISIRGIASPVGAATTGIYIDDTPIQVRRVGFNASNTYPLVFDLERIEVLRGPQGTLFGAGSQGGTIRFITPQPSLSDSSLYGRAEMSTTKGGDPSFEAGLAVGAPLIEDKLGYRVSAWFRRDGGWVDRVSYPNERLVDRNANWSNSQAFRGALTLAATESLRITPAIYYQKTFTNDTAVFWEQLSDRKEGVFRNGNPLSTPGRDWFVLPSVSVDLDIGDVLFESETSFFKRKSDIMYDYTSTIAGIFAGTPYPYLQLPGYVVEANMINRQENWTQEFRLSSTNSDARLKWVLGVFWTNQEQESEQWDYDPRFPELIMHFRGLTIPQAFGPTARTDTPYDLINLNSGVDKQLAGFGQADLRLLDGLTLTAGLRVSETKFRHKADQVGMAIAELHTSGSTSETPVTPKVGLSWQVDPNNLLYATAAKGFRIGGANDPQNPVSCAADFRALGITASPLTYDSDSVWNYEIGSKNTLLDGRLQLAASVFRVDWSNIQRSVPLSSCANSFTDNLGTARSEGADLTVVARPAQNLSLNLAVGYTDAAYSETIRASSGRIIVEEGDALGAPKWTVTAGAEYTFALSDHDAFLRGDYRYIGRVPREAFLNPNSTTFDRTLFQLPAQQSASLRAGLRFENIDASVFVDNLFDAAPLLARSHSGRTSPLYFLSTYRPRTIGLTVTARY